MNISHSLTLFEDWYLFWSNISFQEKKLIAAVPLWSGCGLHIYTPSNILGHPRCRVLARIRCQSNFDIEWFTTGRLGTRNLRSFFSDNLPPSTTIFYCHVCLVHLREAMVSTRGVHEKNIKLYPKLLAITILYLHTSYTCILYTLEIYIMYMSSKLKLELLQYNTN